MTVRTISTEASQMPLELFHFIQLWLALDVIGGLWFAYAVHNAPWVE